MADQSIQQSYAENPGFWKRDSPRILGDIEQRPLAVKMLGNRSQILDAGCGTGYVTRMLAQRGAIVKGLDNSREMLTIAEEIEKATKSDRKIEYIYGKVTNFSQIIGSTDGIVCVGAVHHLSPKQYNLFLTECLRTLRKEDSPLVMSLGHPSLFYPGSPARTQERCWVKLSPLEDKPFDQSQKFSGQLYDVDGNHFDSTFWYHPMSFLFNSLSQNGFQIQEVREPIFRKEHQLTPTWGESYGYPSHLIIKARK